MSHHETKENEINFTKQAFEISWNYSLREIYSIIDMHFRSISADIDNSNWGYRRFVEGKIVLDTCSLTRAGNLGSKVAIHF